jgi:hypothetical protein
MLDWFNVEIAVPHRDSSRPGVSEFSEGVMRWFREPDQ